MKRLGYTLSEVLVTLAIIGVVSAMTIPVLVSGHNKQMCAKTLSTAVFDFEAAMKNMIQKEGVDDLLETEAWKLEEITADSFREKLNKYLPVKNSAPRTYASLGASSSSFTTNEASSLWYLTSKGEEFAIYVDADASLAKSEAELIEGGYTYRKKAAEVCVDVNGSDKPNTYGRDFFCYELSVDGDMHPLGGYEYAKYHHTGSGEPTISNAKTECLNNKDGLYCAEYLKQNNYKMDY